MARKSNKAKPRTRREYPQAARVFSTNFLNAILDHDQKCFVPLADYQKLERKYLSLFKRYKRK